MTMEVRSWSEKLAKDSEAVVRGCLPSVPHCQALWPSAICLPAMLCTVAGSLQQACASKS